MGKKTRSITALIKSGKHKRFRNLDYDFLEDGDRILRGQVDDGDELDERDDDAAVSSEVVSKQRPGASSNSKIGAKVAVGAKKAPSADPVPTLPKAVGAKAVPSADMAVGARSVPTSDNVKSKKQIDAKIAPSAKTAVGTDSVPSTKPAPSAKVVVGVKSVPGAASVPNPDPKAARQQQVGADTVPSAESAVGAELVPAVSSRVSASPSEGKLGTKTALGAKAAPSVAPWREHYRSDLSEVGTESALGTNSVPTLPFSIEPAAASDIPPNGYPHSAPERDLDEISATSANMEHQLVDDASSWNSEIPVSNQIDLDKAWSQANFEAVAEVGTKAALGAGTVPSQPEITQEFETSKGVRSPDSTVYERLQAEDRQAGLLAEMRSEQPFAPVDHGSAAESRSETRGPVPDRQTHDVSASSPSPRHLVGAVSALGTKSAPTSAEVAQPTLRSRIGTEMAPNPTLALGTNPAPSGHSISEGTAQRIGADSAPSLGVGSRLGTDTAPSSNPALGTNMAPSTGRSFEASALEALSVTPTLGTEVAPRLIKQGQALREELGGYLGTESAPSAGVALGAKTAPTYPAAANARQMIDGIEYLAIPRSVLARLATEDLSPREMRIFLAIAIECLSMPGGIAEISGNDLTARTEVHRSHVFTALKVLVDRELVLKEKQESAGKNLYRLNLAYFESKAPLRT